MKLDDYIQAVYKTASDQGDVVPLLQDAFEQYGDATAEALLDMPELPEMSFQARYMITHAIEKIDDNPYTDMLLKKLPNMESACPRFMHFLVRRVVRSLKTYDVLLQKIPSASQSSRAMLKDILATCQGDEKEKAEVRERCLLGLRQLDNP